MVRNKTNLPHRKAVEIQSLAQISAAPTVNGLYKTEEHYGVGMPMAHMGDIFATDILTSIENMQLVDITEKEKAKFTTRYGDILFARRSLKPEGAGDATLVATDIPLTFESSIIRFRPEQGVVLPRFLFEYLRSPYGKAQMRTFVRQVAVSGVTGSDLRLYQVPVPPLPEQKKIAEILSTWDKAIETTEKLLANAEAQKKALMQQLLTGKRRLKGFDGEWKEVRLGDLVDVKRGASPRPISDTRWFAEEGRGWVRISDVTASRTEQLQHTTQYLSNEGVQKSVNVDPGELIMSICATIGVPKIVGIPVCIHDGFVVFRNMTSKLSNIFLYYYLQLITPRLASGGQPGTQKNLNISIVASIKVPNLSKQEQQAISELLKSSDRIVLSYTTKLEKLKSEKRALMQQLLTGKRRVKV